MPHPKPRPVTTAAEIVRFGKMFRSICLPFRKGKIYVAATKGGAGKKAAAIRVLSVHPTAAKAWAAVADAKAGNAALWKVRDAAGLTVFGPIQVLESVAPDALTFDVCHHDCSCETMCRTTFAAADEILSIELTIQSLNARTGLPHRTTLAFPPTTDTIFLGRKSFADYTRLHD